MAEKRRDQGDQPVLGHIKKLVDEEHKLYGQEKPGQEDRARLGRIEVELDQCWDLLRQRRARREFGQNPNEAQVRGPGTVENYKQ